MRLGWLHDFKLEDRLGGAQLNNAAMAEAAPDWAEVVRCYPGEDVPDCDAYVLHNVKFFSQLALRRATDKPHVKAEHDLWDCPQWWQKYWVAPVMNAAEAVIFLSPLHREAFLREHSGVKPKKTYLVPSPIVPTRFTPGVKTAGTCWLGEFQPHKGIEAACTWAAEHGPVDFYGFGPHPPSGANVNLEGALPYERVPGMLARYERFLFLPEWVEAFGRTVAEAALSGCELVCNDRVGAFSWGWETREEWAEGVGTASERFWGILEAILC